MRIQFVELRESLREGGLEKAAYDMAHFLDLAGVHVLRGEDVNFPDLANADVVHFHGLWAPAHYPLARECRRLRTPCVVSPHGMLEPWAWAHRRWKKWPYFYLFEKRRLNWADALLATADNERHNLRRFFPNQHIDVLPLGIGLDVGPDYETARKELGWSDEERVLLYLSRIHPKKGLSELLDALSECVNERRYGKIRMVIVGDGPVGYVNECRKSAEKLSGRVQVEWIPPQWGEAKWRYLQGADLFCLPTYSENFGIVLLEAGIVGTPVLTTTGTPWKPISKAGFGWVVEAKHEEYMRVLREFLSLPRIKLMTKRRPFSEWTRQHYAWPQIIGKYKDLYAQLMVRQP